MNHGNRPLNENITDNRNKHIVVIRNKGKVQTKIKIKKPQDMQDEDMFGSLLEQIYKYINICLVIVPPRSSFIYILSLR